MQLLATDDSTDKSIPNMTVQ